MENKPLPKVKLNVIRRTALVVSLVLIVFGSGVFVGSKYFPVLANSQKIKVNIDRGDQGEHNELDFSLFWRVWDTLRESYYDPGKIVDAQLVYGAIQGMVSAVGDPYTVFLPPTENKVVQEDLSGNFEGIGIHIGFKGSRLAVIAPLEGSPAQEAGVKAGDLIAVIKDEAEDVEVGTVGMTLQEAVELIRGEAGSIVTLTLIREGVEEPIEVNIRRESIDVPSVTLSYLGDNKEIAEIRLAKFVSATDSEWEKTVRDILKNPQVTGIILDLRGNPGGYLLGARDIASEFVDQGEVVVIEAGNDGSREELEALSLGRLKRYKLVVLIDGGSASASEILSGALRDILGTPLVGETSFGKGTIQESIQVNGGSGLHVTTAKWLTPKGTWVNENPLEPDYKVTDNPDTPEDEQVDRAIEVLNNL